MKTKVIIEVKGGCVQSVYTPNDGIDVEIEICDLDISDCATEAEIASVESMERVLDKIASDNAWCQLF